MTGRACSHRIRPHRVLRSRRMVQWSACFDVKRTIGRSRSKVESSDYAIRAVYSCFRFFSGVPTPTNTFSTLLALSMDTGPLKFAGHFVPADSKVPSELQVTRDL